MRFTLFVFFCYICLEVLLTWHIGRCILRDIKRTALRRWIMLVHIILSASALVAMCAVPILGLGQSSDNIFILISWLMLWAISIVVPQLVFCIFDWIASIPQLFRRKHIRAISLGGLGLAVMMFIILMWGALINRFNLRVNEIDITIPDLPEAFDGYTVAHISDLHVGSFASDTTFVSRVVDRINELSPDIVVFTGDLVNRHASEAEPFLPVINRLHGLDGQFAVMGNHDYADYYYPMDSIERKEADRALFKSMLEGTSIDLLNDVHRIIRRGNDSIAVIGVENIGYGHFPAYGSLEKAYPALSDSVFKILLSHDPAHWTRQVSGNPSCNLALTLSGHTHAMQIKLFGWTPAVMTSPTPGGLYVDRSGHKYLNVNTGIGTVGPPFRIGAAPEITLIRLHK